MTTPRDAYLDAADAQTNDALRPAASRQQRRAQDQKRDGERKRRSRTPSAKLSERQRKVKRPEKLIYPDHGYIESRATERTSRMGGGGVVQAQAWHIPTTYDGMVMAVRGRRQQQVDPAIPSNFRGTAKDVRAGQALIDDAITVVAGTFNQGKKRIRVVAKNESKPEADRSAKIKQWVTAAILGGDGWPSALQQESGEPWLDLGIEQACGDGRAIWELLDRKEQWSPLYGYPVQEDYTKPGEDGAHTTDPDYEAFLKATDKWQERAPFPFQVNRVDPLAYDQWMTAGKATEAIKIERRPRREVYPTYGLKAERPNGAEGPTRYVLGEPYPEQQLPVDQHSQMARCVTFWRAEPMLADENGDVPVCWVFEVDGQRVDCGETIGPSWHPLPFFPFNGIHTSLPDAAYKGVSIAFRLLRLCDAIDTLLSMKFNVAALMSMCIWIKTTPEGGNFDINTGGLAGAAAGAPTAAQSGWAGTFTMEPGKGYELYQGQDIKALVPPPEAVAILDSLKEDLMAFIDLVGLPAALRGISPGAGSAGYLVAQLIAAARTKLSSVLQNATDALVMLIRYLLWSIDRKFPEGVPLVAGEGEIGSWLKVAPKDVDGRYDVQVQLSPLLPVDELQQHEASLTQQQAGAISMKRHRETLGIDNPEEEAEQIAAEKIETHPLLELPRALDAAVRLGRLTPLEAQAIKAKEFGIPINDPAAQVNVPFVLDAQGNPIMPGQGQMPPGVPAVPGAPDVPPVAPPPPTAGAQQNNVAMQQVAGAPGTNMGPQQQPNRAAVAVGS